MNGDMLNTKDVRWEGGGKWWVCEECKLMIYEYEYRYFWRQAKKKVRKKCKNVK